MRNAVRLVPGPSDHVVVIGAGLGGLSATLRLLGAGRSVTVLEQAAGPGGRAGLLRQDGYQFDTGPTVLTMPGLIDDALACVGEKLSDRVQLMPVGPAYRANFADGSAIDVHTDPDQMAGEIARVATPADAAGYRELVTFLRELYQLEMSSFIDRNLDSAVQLVGSAGLRLLAMGGLRKMAPKIGQYLRDDRLRRIFSFQAMYAGLAPQDALAIYAVISYMDTVAGVYFPRGGMRALPDALAGAAESAGVQFRYGATVTALDRSGSRIRAVHTNTGLRMPCDAVVLATELTTAYELLGRAPRRPLPLRPAPSAVVLHAGTGRRWPDAAHHTIVFGDAWQQTFREIITDGQLMSDPSLLVTRPTATDPSLAPEGSDLVYILAPAPNLARGRIDWAGTASGYADQLASIVGNRVLPGLDAQITVRQVVTPADWARQGLVAGTPFSFAHSFLQSGPFRPGNLPRGTDNAVLAGCGTVPGVGVPTALISGRLAADRVTGPVPALARRPAVRRPS
jgi:phytoene desaturase